MIKFSFLLSSFIRGPHTQIHAQWGPSLSHPVIRAHRCLIQSRTGECLSSLQQLQRIYKNCPEISTKPYLRKSCPIPLLNPHSHPSFLPLPQLYIFNIINREFTAETETVKKDMKAYIFIVLNCNSNFMSP